MTKRLALSRRAFIGSAIAVGGAFALGFRLEKGANNFGGDEPVEVLNWVVLAPDNTVTIRIAQMEMGQGAMTGMAQLLAEELEVDWSIIRTEFVSIADQLRRHRVFGRTETSASAGLRLADLPLRTAGAQIRTILIKAAARRLNVPEAELVAKNGIVVHRPTGAKLTYGELAPDCSTIPVPHPDSIRLKDPRDWKVMGRSLARLDIPSKTNGSAIFGIDVTRPGMKYAAIAMSPVFGGKLKFYDASAILSIPGVQKVVEVRGGTEGFVNGMDEAIAVIANDWWTAKKAIDAMPIEWDGGDQTTIDSAAILANLQAALEEKYDEVLRQDGDAAGAIVTALQRIEADYFVPYLEQATMEPMNCTAFVTERTFEVWAPTQHPESAMRIASKVAALPIKKGELHCTQLGGGFGRRIECDVVSQAVQIAKAMKGVPIKLLWTREDTTRHGYYRQASLSRLRAGIDSNGNISAWTHHIVAQSNDKVHSTYGADSLLYGIPNIEVGFSVRHSHVPEGSMRGVGYSITCFVVQSFLDELALATGKDSYQLQRELLDPRRTPSTVPRTEFEDALEPKERSARLRTVLDNAAITANWSKSLGPNRGRGLAVLEQSGGYYAVVVEVTIDGGWVKVDRVVVVGDPGQLANPGNARAQIEGSVAFGLTSALYGEIRLSEGRVVDGNFDEYRMLRLDEMPEVEVYWVLGRRFWGDVSQAVVSVVQPALTNAIYDAGGPRIRSLPIKNHKIVRRDAEFSAERQRQ
jgi:isoquinoline 1-oxidoreductase beta subunit